MAHTESTSTDEMSQRFIDAATAAGTHTQPGRREMSVEEAEAVITLVRGGWLKLELTL